MITSSESAMFPEILAILQQEVSFHIQYSDMYNDSQFNSHNLGELEQIL
jgi:hypothetical protein